MLRRPVALAFKLSVFAALALLASCATSTSGDGNGGDGDEGDDSASGSGGGGTAGTSPGGSSAGGQPTFGGSLGESGTSGSTSSAGSSGKGTGGATGTSGSTGTGGTGTGGSAAGSTGTAGKGGSTSSGGATSVFFDDFEGMDKGWLTDPPSDSGWSVVTEGAGNHAFQEMTVTNVLRVASAGGLAGDQAVEARVKILSFGGQSTSYLAGILGRVSGANNFYGFMIRSNGTVGIRARKNGSNTSLGGSENITLTLNTWYTLRLEIRGGTVTGFVNGMPLITATDSAPLPMGAVGLCTVNASAQFDDVRLSTL